MHINCIAIPMTPKSSISFNLTSYCSSAKCFAKLMINLLANEKSSVKKKCKKIPNTFHVYYIDLMFSFNKISEFYITYLEHIFGNIILKNKD